MLWLIWLNTRGPMARVTLTSSGTKLNPGLSLPLHVVKQANVVGELDVIQRTAIFMIKTEKFPRLSFRMLVRNASSKGLVDVILSNTFAAWSHDMDILYSRIGSGRSSRGSRIGAAFDILSAGILEKIPAPLYGRLSGKLRPHTKLMAASICWKKLS